NTGVRVLSGLDDGEGDATPNNNVLEADEVDAQRALCVDGADLTVKDSGGCSIANGAGAKTHSTQWSTSAGALWLVSLAGVFIRRRRRNRR
ncbi:MAG TPA: hypothetical protein VFG30_02540, partial [Polyangiales bacterium]|nr:hypothetical protein [Polyangiales bacterium]